MAVARSGLSPAAERVVAFLVGIGHPAELAEAMARNLLGDAHPDRRVARRYGSLTMTPDERERFAGALQARRVLIEGALLSLGGDVREGAVLSAHALCEAHESRRPLTLRIGGARAQLEQITAARERLIGERDAIDSLVEAAVEPADGDTDDLKQGVGGAKPHPRVVHLQNRLNMLGHRVAADGKFGPVTAEAVKDFQAKAGMDPSGVVDKDTSLALRHGRRVVEVGPAAVLPQMPSAKPLTDIGVGDPNKETTTAAAPKLQVVPAPIGLGAGVGEDGHPEVQELQKGLSAAGMPMAQDGRFGPTTAAALKKFQKAHGLPPTGVADDRTRRALKELSEAVLTKDTRDALPASAFVFSKERAYPIHDEAHARAALSLGAKHESGGRLAQIRAAVRSRYPNIGKIEEGHVELTEAAVAELDVVSLEEAASELDELDLALIQEAADSLAKASTPEPFSTSKTSNWVARAGGLPAYIQHIAHDLVEKRGKSESNAIQMAIGIVKRWAKGGGNVDAGTRAAATKAVAEWMALRAKSAASKVAGAVGKAASKLREADSRADYPETLACPSCGARTKASAKTCPRGHSMERAKALTEALIASLHFDRDMELLLREHADLRETWEQFDAQRHQASWGKHVKAGPMPGTWKDSPGRGPTGKLRNFESMGGPKLKATLEALMVHGEDHEAHQAAMFAAGKKLGMKIHIPRPAPPKVHTLLDECRCGAPVRAGAVVCQRGHRLEEAWSPQARAAAIAAREHNRPAGSFKVGDHVEHDAGGNTGTVVAKTADAVHIAPKDPSAVDWGATEHGTHAGTKTLSYAHDAPMAPVTGSFKARPPQALKQRGT